VAHSSQTADLPYSRAIAERVWGCALSRLGQDLSQAESHFETALEICQSTDQVMNAAQTELWWGRIHRERGDEASAQAHFAKALRSMEAGGYEYALTHAQQIVKGD